MAAINTGDPFIDILSGYMSAISLGITVGIFIILFMIAFRHKRN